MWQSERAYTLDGDLGQGGLERIMHRVSGWEGGKGGS